MDPPNPNQSNDLYGRNGPPTSIDEDDAEMMRLLVNDLDDQPDAQRNPQEPQDTPYDYGTEYGWDAVAGTVQPTVEQVLGISSIAEGYNTAPGEAIDPNSDLNLRVSNNRKRKAADDTDVSNKKAKANTEEKPTTTKRAIKISKVSGEIGSDIKAKGQVRFAMGAMWHRERDNDNWEPAVYHDELRHGLLHAASQLGQYVFDRTSGEHEDDKTSFHPGQRTWGPNKPNWPPLDHQLEKRDYRDPVYEVPIWMDHGRVVLDPDNHPVKRFREIPTTCSSEMEGWLMEGIRRQNSSIGYKDFRARMPRSPGANQDKPLYSLSTFSMRGTRFREKHGLLSWDTRAGTARLNEYFRGLKSQASITSNSTLNERDPTEVEIAESKRLNKGKHSERAGLRKLATEERQKRDQAAQRKLEKLKAKEAAANPTSVPGKRRRQAEQTIDDDGGDSDLERGDAKRRRKDPQQIRGNQPYWNGPQEILPHQHSYSRDAFHHQPFPQQAPSNATGYVGRDSQSHPGQYPNIHGSYGFEALAQAQQSSGSYPSVYSPDTMNDISRYWSELRRSELRRSELRRAPEPNFDQYGNEAFARAPLQQAHPSSQPQFYTSAEWMPVNQGLTEIETNQAVGIHNPVLFDTTQPAAVHPASQTRTTTPVSLENHIEPGTIVPWQVHDVNPSYAQQVYQNAVDESYGTGNDEVWEEPPPVDDNVDYLLPVDETRHHQDQTDEEFRFFDTMTEQEVDQWNQNTFGNIMANSSSLLQEDGDTTLLGDDTTVQGDGDTTLQGDAITSLIEAAKGKSLEPETPADELSTDQAQPAIVSGGEVVSNSEPVDPDPSEEEAKAIVEKIAQKVLQKEAQDEGFEDETTAWNEAFPWEDLDTFIANNLHTIVDPLDQNPAVATQGNDDPDHASHHQDEAPESSNHGESTHERNTDGLIDESFDPSERPDSSEAVQNEKPEPEQGSANAHTEENLGGWGYCF